MNKRPNRYFSNKQEQSVAKAVGGKQVANSGATPFKKGDVSTRLILIECKTSTTEKQSFSIKKEWLDKNDEEAFAMGKFYSALAFNFGDGVNHYVISEEMFQMLNRHLEELY